jgi:L-rhamnono-1,4-lactonase
MSESTRLLNPPAVAEFLLPWFKVIIQAFGPQGIIFASDWPVCSIGVENAWAHWKSIVEVMCAKLDLDASDIEAIFAGTAKESYNL